MEGMDISWGMIPRLPDLVNIQKTMENHHSYRQIIYKLAIFHSKLLVYWLLDGFTTSRSVMEHSKRRRDQELAAVPCLSMFAGYTNPR